MLSPKKVKFRKQQKGRMRGQSFRGSTLNYGDFGLQAVECGYITARQIEAGRIAMTRQAKRGGKMWIRMFPDKPVTKKPAEVRMGKGKGAPEGFPGNWRRKPFASPHISFRSKPNSSKGAMCK